MGAGCPILPGGPEASGREGWGTWWRCDAQEFAAVPPSVRLADSPSRRSERAPRMGSKCPALPSKPPTEEWTTPLYTTAQEIHALATRQRACHPPMGTECVSIRTPTSRSLSRGLRALNFPNLFAGNGPTRTRNSWWCGRGRCRFRLRFRIESLC